MKEDNPRKSHEIAEVAFKTSFSKLGNVEAEYISYTSTVEDLISHFESASHIDDGGVEYWHARNLAKLLGYTDYRNFLAIVSKAMEACKTSGQPVENHFVEVNEMVEIGSNAERQIRANNLHFGVGKKIRQTIRDLGGTMPENLATAENIEKVAKRLKKAAVDELSDGGDSEA